MLDSLQHVLFAFFGALFLSLLATPLARNSALRMNFVDRPGDRKKHLMATPLLGGAGIYVAFALSIVAGLLIWPGLTEGTVADTPLNWKTISFLVIAGGFLLTLTGLLDDILVLSPRRKLLLQSLAAVAVGAYFVVSGLRLSIFLSGSTFAWLAAPITILWLLGITNAMNLLDHADGLSGGVAAIASVFFAIINLLARNDAVAFICASLAGACIGFLVFNFNPASIFMGDSGSNFLGFTLGVIAVLGVYTPGGSIRELSIFSPLLVLAVPLLDTFLVVMYRMRKRVPILKGDRNHMAHRLMRIGFSHRQAVVLLWCIGALLGVLALLLPTLKPYQAVLVFAHAVGFAAVIAFFIHRGEKAAVERP
jgi:UDP-GlcNAc:undecaprenyl-phosphate/decaprenyl-phosphate GlcNAc-1-phosphate transferase